MQPVRLHLKHRIQMNNIVHSIFVISNICTEHIDKNMKFGNIWFMDGLLTEDIHTVLTFLTCYTVFSSIFVEYQF